MNTFEVRQLEDGYLHLLDLSPPSHISCSSLAVVYPQVLCVSSLFNREKREEMNLFRIIYQQNKRRKQNLPNCICTTSFDSHFEVCNLIQGHPTFFKKNLISFPNQTYRSIWFLFLLSFFCSKEMVYQLLSFWNNMIKRLQELYVITVLPCSTSYIPILLTYSIWCVYAPLTNQ